MNTQITKTPKLIQDLGMKYPTQNSKCRARYGLYKCFCGNEFETRIQSARSGLTTSCGCYKKQRTTKHGLTKHRLYDTWKSIIRRCNNQNNKAYKNYGGRGITVADRWLDINNFINDMYPSYVEGLSIDRIDVNGNYCKDNCRWATKEVQNRNTRVLCKNNTSGYRGVSFKKKANKFQSYITVNSKNIHIGMFKTKLEAAKAYDNYIISNNLEHTKNFNNKDIECKTK